MDNEEKPVENQPEPEEVDQPVHDEPVHEHHHDHETHERRLPPVGKSGRTEGSKLEQFKTWYVEHKKIAIPASALLLILLLAIIPWSRYHAAGLVVKNDIQLTIKDDATNTPVSGATLSVGKAQAITDANGQATLPGLSVGHHKLAITKKYYKDRQADVLVPILSSKAAPTIQVTATGRQVKVKLTNLIDGSAISDVNVDVNGESSKTDKAGVATIVVAPGVTSQEALLTRDGYNDKKLNLKVSASKIEQNDIKLTPAGKVYFLSKLSGKIDVVKTNLDGTDRATVLAGTGKEADRNTVLLASTDWKYLALLSKRDGKEKLYIISADDDKTLSMDTSDGTFNLVGWDGHYFVYDIVKADVADYQNNHEVLKSYNAETGQALTLDQTQAIGTASSYGSQTFSNYYIVNHQALYTSQWAASDYYAPVDLTGKTDLIRAIGVNGQHKVDLKSFDSTDAGYTSAALYEPGGVYFERYNYTANKQAFYKYEDGSLKDSQITQEDFDKTYPTFLASPSGKETFWSESRDGKFTLFTGDSSGGNSKTLANLSEYQNYGWYSDNYLLVSKKGSELYILPKRVIKADSEALKVSDYHKPDQTFLGYGGGYGGL